ncbi:heme-binding domain-containing protein [Epilithonimonas sp. JDS]|uniref:heme-binding domain-containing protein n=1 Tax=Epilithonimonas sp. JDS TaxID=2902797 RepID=UPI001E5FF36F|nr:heme-binding domain-containing protein [Epilithonimonas sp. JDS]MCD9856631.1 heme-binding domain-containing protein [Epilithonimonas sp. JDS]
MKKIIFWIALGFLGIQLIPVDRENKAVNRKDNFVDIYKTPDNIRVILKNACYDCHSNETEYPTYSYIAPISWTIKDHINDGREHLNFSEWGSYNKDLRENAVEKNISNVQDLEMPLPSYIGYHPKANLTTKQRETLINYFKDLEIK